MNYMKFRFVSLVKGRVFSVAIHELQQQSPALVTKAGDLQCAV